MGKGKKKTKGKKRGGKKESDGNMEEENDTFAKLSKEQKDIAIAACANRKEDPLKNWTRLQNEECPICMLPLPLLMNEQKHCVTCGKTVCMGCVVCVIQVQKRDGKEVEKAFEKANTCPYCRSSTANDNDTDVLEKEMKRANAGDHKAMYHLGEYYFGGKMGLRQDKVEGLKWFHRAMVAGDGTAAFFWDCAI